MTKCLLLLQLKLNITSTSLPKKLSLIMLGRRAMVLQRRVQRRIRRMVIYAKYGSIAISQANQPPLGRKETILHVKRTVLSSLLLQVHLS